MFSAKLETLESVAPVLDTSESVARNWTCATTTKVSVADGRRRLLLAEF